MLYKGPLSLPISTLEVGSLYQRCGTVCEKLCSVLTKVREHQVSADIFPAAGQIIRYIKNKCKINQVKLRTKQLFYIANSLCCLSMSNLSVYKGGQRAKGVGTLPAVW